MWQSQVEIKHYSVVYFDCIITFEADRSCLFPGSLTVAFSPTWGVHVYWYTWYPRMTPRCWKELWDCCCSCHCHFSLPTMSQPYCECALALYINGDRQRWHRPLLGLAYRCDTTIGNEFLESDPSLEITSLKCCILTQNQKGPIIRAPTVVRYIHIYEHTGQRSNTMTNLK